MWMDIHINIYVNIIMDIDTAICGYSKDIRIYLRNI